MNYSSLISDQTLSDVILVVFFPVDMHERNLAAETYPEKSTSLAKKKDFDICVSFFFGGGEGGTEKST